MSNECIGSYTIVDWMYQESARGVRLAPYGWRPKGAPLGTFSIPNECIGSYTLVDWMSQEGGG